MQHGFAMSLPTAAALLLAIELLVVDFPPLTLRRGVLLANVDDLPLAPAELGTGRALPRADRGCGTRPALDFLNQLVSGGDFLSCTTVVEQNHRKA